MKNETVTKVKNEIKAKQVILQFILRINFCQTVGRKRQIRELMNLQTPVKITTSV